MLECRDVAVRYGRVEALHGLSLSISDGQAVSVVGANGAGKTTLLRAVMGLEPLTRGSVRFDDVDLHRMPTHRISRLGIALVPAGGSLFGNLTVLENLRLGVIGDQPRSGQDSMDRVLAIFPLLAGRLGQKVRTLSGGERQILAIGRALVGKPRVVLLDEPSFGLAPAILEQILAALRHLNDEGMTVVLVEQDARLALEFATFGHVLANGRVVASGPTDVLRSQAGVESLYFGGELGE
jgi:branched-chain amino acid transport system ATP-binding protein